MTPRHIEGHQLGLRYVELIKRLNAVIADMRTLHRDSEDFGVDIATLMRMDSIIRYLEVAAIDEDQLDAKVAEVEAELAEHDAKSSV